MKDINETDLADHSIHGDPEPVFLYSRNNEYIPRIAAVHDLCGYGKCSLGVAIPVLSAAGCDVCPNWPLLFAYRIPWLVHA